MNSTPFAPDTRAVYQASVGDLPVTLIAFEGDVAGKRYYFGNIHAPGFGESHGIEESLLIIEPAQVAALFAEIDPDTNLEFTLDDIPALDPEPAPTPSRHDELFLAALRYAAHGIY